MIINVWLLEPSVSYSLSLSFSIARQVVHLNLD